MNAEQLQSHETKNRIMFHARHLFAKFGFDGASVRDIAKESQVNIAAINYHFKNKENLFWEIITESYKEGELACKRIFDSCQNLEEFSLKVYDHYFNSKDMIRNTMKMILSDNLNPPTESMLCKKMSESDTFGPPGGSYFAQLLIKEIPYVMRPEAIAWGVKSLFGNIIHWSMMCSTSHFCALAEKEPLMSPEQIRKDVHMMIRSTIYFMKHNPDLFRSSLLRSK